MQQLSGQDAMFVHAELEGMPQHIGGISIYDQGTARGGKVRFKQILALMKSRLHLSPIFRRKLVAVPFGLGQPYWADDPDFDLEYHVRHIALPKPGDWRQLCILAARIHSRPLARDKPLWEMYIIEGLDNVHGLPKGCFGMLLKVHHAAMDGAAGSRFMSLMLDTSPLVADVPEAPPWEPDVPSRTSMLAKAYGEDRKAYHLTADYTWGWTQEESMAAATEAMGWETVQKVRTPLGAGDFSQYLTPVLNSGADVLILNHYGRDMVNSLTQAVNFGLRDKEVNGKHFEIVVPLYSRLMAQGAGENAKGIFGSTNWHWSLQDDASKAFVKSFGQKYGFPPSQAAHTCYVQTLLYADAAHRAGTFNPCGIAEALEGFEFDGMGNGPTLYRAADHQCFKDVLVVKGKENPASEFDLLEVVQVTPRAQVEYAPDHEMFAGGNLGSCNPGA